MTNMDVVIDITDRQDDCGEGQEKDLGPSRPSERISGMRTETNPLYRKERELLPTILAKPSGLWTQEEKVFYNATFKELGNNSTTVTKPMPGKSKDAVSVFASQGKDFKTRPARPSSMWTDDEKAAFVAAYDEFGNNWTVVAKRLPGRSEKDVSMFAAKKGYSLPRSSQFSRWSSEELAALEAGCKEFGSKWSTIAKRLPGRTAWAVKRKVKLQHIEVGNKRLLSTSPYRGPSSKRQKKSQSAANCEAVGEEGDSFRASSHTLIRVFEI